MSSETSTKKSVSKKTLVWLFPSAAEQIFAGYSKKEHSFIFGCAMPSQVRDITYWPGSVTKKDISIPPTVLLQYMPIFYGDKQPYVVPGTEISCSCKSCLAWYNWSTNRIGDKPRTKMFHLGVLPGTQSQFGMYQLIKRENSAIIRRLAMGNNKHSDHLIMQSMICWYRMKRPVNLLEAYSSFWRSYFSFSYTGREKSLDNPDGYEDYLENYHKLKNSDESAKICNDKEIDLAELLGSLDGLLLSDERHYGITVDLRGPRKIPKIQWVDKEDDKLIINGKPVDNVQIQSSV